MARGGSKTEPHDEDKFGEPTKYDPSFNGPIKNRSCTDVICCLFFIICIVAMFAVSVLAYTRGNPYRLLYPSDSEGNICGTGDYADKPYVFFFDLVDCAKVGAAAVVSSGCPTPQICVHGCPKKEWSWAYQEAMEQADPSARKYRNQSMICKNGIDPVDTHETLSTLVSNEDCAAYYLESDSLVGRCIPTIITSVANYAFSGNFTDKLGNVVNGTALAETGWLTTLLNVQSYGEKIFSDVRASWVTMLVGLGIGALLAFIWILLMRWIAGVIIWVTLFLFFALFTFCTYFSFTKYVELKNNSTSDITFNDIELTTSLDYWANLYYTWLVAGIISAVLLFIVLVIIIFLRKRILIAIELIKESSRAVGAMIFTLFWPLFPFILELILFAYWGASALFLASMGSADYGEANKTVANISVLIDGSYVYQNQTIVNAVISAIPCDPSGNDTASSICSFIKYGGDEYTIYLQFFQLFMLFWLMNFIVALGQMTLAGAFASYYWAYNKPKDIPAFPLAASLYRCFRYHLGTLAFGSLIIAIIQIIRVILEYIDHKLKDKENAVTKFILTCLKCCFWCLEKFMKFLNKNAYILTAVYGKNFCTSAKNAFMLIMRNIVRVVVTDKVTDFLLFVGKLVVTSIIVGMAFVFFSGDLEKYVPIDSITSYLNNYVPSLNFYLVPVIIIAIGTYIVASAFFSVYSMAVDTLFLCFLEDLERNDGSEEKPYYMSKGMMSILDLKNQHDENKKKK